jgi:hypothetical protein
MFLVQQVSVGQVSVQVQVGVQQVQGVQARAQLRERVQLLQEEFARVAG